MQVAERILNTLLDLLGPLSSTVSTIKNLNRASISRNFRPKDVADSRHQGDYHGLAPSDDYIPAWDRYKSFTRTRQTSWLRLHPKKYEYVAEPKCECDSGRIELLKQEEFVGLDCDAMAEVCRR